MFEKPKPCSVGMTHTRNCVSVILSPSFLCFCAILNVVLIEGRIGGAGGGAGGKQEKGIHSFLGKT
jgi:hypothetical protein